jgi:hypothetical protein
MLSNRYQTRNIKPLPVDNFIFRGIKPASNLISGIYLAYLDYLGYLAIWGVLLLGVMGLFFTSPAKFGMMDI